MHMLSTEYKCIFVNFPVYIVTNQIQNNNSDKINKIMQEIHSAIMKKTKLYIRLIK